MRTITIAQSDPRWAEEFSMIKAMISGHIGDLIIGIEHVGSTSVPGLEAKPIIDIDVVIEDMTCFPAIIERLNHVGFDHEGNLGVEGREAFKRRFNDGFMPYHLYVCPKDSRGYREHIAFRDYLRSHPDASREYERIKQEFARLYPHDIDSYLNGKNHFIKEILKKTLYGNEKDS
jgi:GrpB-like predicted nucleotidyltransferase (UPF0157 family)